MDESSAFDAIKVAYNLATSMYDVVINGRWIWAMGTFDEALASLEI